MTTPADETEARLCLYCAHWRGNDRHAIEQAPARCAKSALSYTFADETCGQFTDARRKAA